MIFLYAIFFTIIFVHITCDNVFKIFLYRIVQGYTAYNSGVTHFATLSIPEQQ